MVLAANKTAWEGFDWDELLALIEEGQVIPVLGEGLSPVLDGGRERALYDVIADRLRVNLNLDGDHSGLSLHELACRYIGNDLTRLDSLYARIKSIMPRAGELDVPAPLSKLAAIRHFRLYVTTTFDSMMVAALLKERYSATPITDASLRQPPFDVFSYRPGKIQDLSGPFDDSENPVVYHLFGKVSATPDYAVTDEDVLEFMHQLQSKAQQPPRLFEAMSTRRLLIIGCRFTNWLARFFLRMARADRLRTPAKTDYLVDRPSEADRDLVVFLEHFGGGTRLVSWSGVEFVSELHARWMQRFGATLPTPTRRADQVGTVFISYASEDRDVAQKLRDLLETHGLPVWFDRDRLRGGDRWSEELKKNVGSCSVFVPIISRHCLTPETRYFRAEWDWALDIAKRRPADVKFVNPLVIDDTSNQNEAFRQDLRDLQWSRFPGGAVDRGFIDDLTVAHNKYAKPTGDP